MQINKTGMYILSIRVISNEKNFNSQCHSNPIIVVEENISISNQTEEQNYELKFKKNDSHILTIDEGNIIKASIFNCMVYYNISVSNLELLQSNNNNSSRRLSLVETQPEIIILKFYSNDSNPIFINNLLSLNISDLLVFVSAKINGVTYGNDSLSPASSSNLVMPIVVGSVFGSIFFIVLISLLYFYLKKLIYKYKLRRMERVIHYFNPQQESLI